MKRFLICISFLLLFTLLLAPSQAQITIWVKSSLGPKEPLRVNLKCDFEAKKDIYIALYKPEGGVFFFVAPDSSLSSTPVAFANSVQSIDTVVFEIILNEISPYLAGEWYVIVAATEPKQNPFTANYDSETFQYKKIKVRQALKRNLNYFFRLFERGDKESLYSFYTARLISVYNPEIYLQADDLFIRLLASIEGSAWTYQTPPGEISPYVPPEKPGEPSFSMEIVDLSDFEAVDDYEVYPEPVPFLNWLDRRIQPIHFILKARKEFGFSLTKLEKAFLVYFRYKFVKGSDPHQLFIAYSLDGSAYIYDSGAIYNYDGRQIKASEISRPVVLVFNENSVFYPLMQRDDRNRDANLARAISVFGADEDASHILNLFSDTEKEAVLTLREKTRLETEEQKLVAKIFSEGFHPGGMQYLVDFVKLLENQESLWASAISLNWYVRILASALSPFSDYLVQAYEEGSYRELSKRFLEFNQWGGETISAYLATYTIDEGFRMDIGTCTDLSVYGAAALEMMGKRWYRIHGVIAPENTITTIDEAYPHFYVYVPKDEAYLDNGHYIDGHKWGLKYVLGGVPRAGIPTLENFNIDIVTVPEGFFFFQLIPEKRESIPGAAGNLSLSESFSLIRQIYEEASPKFRIPIFNEDFAYYVDSISLEEALDMVQERGYWEIILP